MTPNPRCNWRALVVVTAVLLAPVATPRARGADAARDAAATQPTTDQSPRGAATSPGGAANASTVAVIADERADWSGTLNQLATLLADKDLSALQRLLRPAPIIRPFASDALQTLERLLGATTGSTVLGVHAYDEPPTTLASDLSDDFAAAPADVVPPNIRQRMVPPNEDAARRANETAAEWLVQVLQPDKDEVTGVIVLWPATRGRSIAAAPRRAIFVLVKGEEVDGVYVFRQITFGDPLETPQ